MGDTATRADSLRVHRTGASLPCESQHDPDLSLGDSRSAQEVHSVRAVRHQGAISNIRVDYASGALNVGLGSLTAQDASILTFRAPGDSVTGPSLTISDGESKVIEGTTPGHFLRITRTSPAALVGSESLEFREVFGDVAGFDDIDSDEALAGDDSVRALMFVNEGTESLDDLRVWAVPIAAGQTTDTADLPASGAGTIGTSGSFAALEAQGYAQVEDAGGTVQEYVYFEERTDAVLTVAASGRALGGTTAYNGQADDVVTPIGAVSFAKEAPTDGALTDKTVAGENSIPALTWIVGATTAQAEVIGTLAAGDEYGLWLRRPIPAGMVAEHYKRIDLYYSFVIGATTFTGRLRGRFRVENAALRRWELWKASNGAAFDFDAAPYAVSDAFVGDGPPPDFDGAALTAGQTHLIVPRMRNEYGLLSQNYNTITIEVEAGGAQAAARPTAPSSFQAKVVAGSILNISAQYEPGADDDDRADQWVVFTELDGDPNPLVDTPTAVVAMVGDPILEELNYNTAAIVDGAPVHVVVVARRDGSPDVDSIAGSPLVVTMDGQGPATPLGVSVHGTLAAETPPKQTPPATPADDYVIDAGNNVRIELTEGSAALYGGSALAWRAILRGCETDGLYMPGVWDFENVVSLPGAATSDPIEVGSWTGGDKHLWVNVQGVHVMKIDFTNETIQVLEQDEVTARTAHTAAVGVWERFTEIVFMGFWANSQRWEPYMEVGEDSDWRLPLDFLQHLDQAAIEAL